jgi:DNA-binding transcriptional regulator YiaG
MACAPGANSALISGVLNAAQGDGALTNKEFKQIREELFPTKAAAGRALGVSRMAICHWENGNRRIPEMAAKLLRTLKEEAA